MEKPKDFIAYHYYFVKCEVWKLYKCFIFSDPGGDFKPFNRSTNQTYTVLRLGEMEQRTLPLSNKQRLWTSINNAVLSNPPSTTQEPNSNQATTSGRFF